MKKLSKKILIPIQIVSVLLLGGIDQLLKLLVQKKLYETGTGSVLCIPKVLAWTYARNTGAAFSILTDNTVLLSVFTGAAVLAGVLWLFLHRERNTMYEVCIPLLLAGGLGNLIDRIARGYVIDYIQVLFVDFPIFNFADCLVTCSAIVLILYLCAELFRERKKTNENGADGNG